MEVVKVRVRKWFGEKGFGFGRPVDARYDERDRDVFIHARALDPGLEQYVRVDHPAVGENGKADFKSTAWPELYVEAEQSDRGLRAIRASLTAFEPGTRSAEVANLPPRPMSNGTTSGYGGPQNTTYRSPDAPPKGSGGGGYRAPRGPQEGQRKGGGRDDRRGGRSDWRGGGED